MLYIKRDIEEKIISISKQYACILLTGPRQVGKTTMLEKLEPKRKKVTLDNLQDRELALKDPALFLQIYSPPILIDEVQYAPVLFSYIKIAIGNGAKSGSFWLTGSQSFELMKLAQESLAGRVAIFKMSGLTQNEAINNAKLNKFDLDFLKLNNKSILLKKADINEIFSRIFFGGLPAIVSKKITDRKIFFESYIETYLYRDIKDEINIKDNFKFRNFIKVVACRIGQEINIHSVAQDVDISDDTAKRWLFLLEKSQIIYLLHPYSNKLLKRTIKAPKLYFFDTGVASYLTSHHSPEILRDSSISGAILENYVINQIRGSYFNLAEPFNLYYYRDKEQKEVGLILDCDNSLYAIEIKKTSNPKAHMLKGVFHLRKQKIEIKKTAIICVSDKVSMLDENTLIVPIWSI